MGTLGTEPTEKIHSALVFLDESFALLPFGELSKEGDAFPVGANWSRSFSRTHPVSVEQRVDATLQDIIGEREWAEVVIRGELRPWNSSGETLSAPSHNHVTGGTITGSCSVSLTTGLPKSCRIQREVLMGLVTASDAPLPVRKTIVTTLETYVPPAATTAE